MITPMEIQQMIAAQMPDAKIQVTDMTGTADHFEIAVVSKQFAGKTLIEQHQMLHAILEKEMDHRIHAVKLKTKAA
jgi:stress-induced morphogen